MTRTSRRSFGDNRPSDWSPDWCPPPFNGTPATPGRESFGPAVCKTAEQLGKPLFPAQRLIHQVAGEIDSDSGLFAFQTITAEVHRQFGKTICVLLPQMVTRGLLLPRQRMVYTAQDRNHARAKFEEDYVDELRTAPRLKEGKHFKVRTANGSEKISFPATRSLIWVSATKRSSGHGKTLDVAAIDEAWEHEDTSIDSGFRRPMITRRAMYPGAQQWIVSASGEEDKSFYFMEQCKMGREAARAGKTSGRCHIDWTPPKDYDVFNPENWWYFIPALGHTIREQDVAQDLEDAVKEDDWLRDYASRPLPSAYRVDQVIDPDSWRGQGLTREQADEHKLEDELVVGVAMPPSQSHSALCIAGRRPDGGIHVDLVDTRPGSDWLPARLHELWDKWPDIVGVAVDTTGPAAWLLGELERREIDVLRTSQSEYANYCAGLVQKVGQGTVWYCHASALDAAVAGSSKRLLGDRWAWDRRRPDVDISPLESATLAVGGLATHVSEEFSDAYDDGVDEDW